MLIGTHLLMSRVLYDYLSYEQGFKIHRLAFMYGCIKPDLNNADIKNPHLLDESADTIFRYSEKLMTDNMSIKKLSVSLGVICHFICDYFCLYHNGEYKLKNIAMHILYEVKLHCKFLITSNININKYSVTKKNISGIILEMHEKYLLEGKKLVTDIEYALWTATKVSEFILCSSMVFEKSIDPISEIYNVVD